MVTEYGRIHTDGSRSGGQMAVITRKAHMAMIEVLAEWGLEPRNATAQQLAVATTEALCRAIDQQEDLRQPTQSDDEAYELGMRDGYESAVQDIDMLTGGDGEYCCGGERHCPDPDSMKARIAERFNSQPKTVTVTVVSAADGKAIHKFKIDPTKKTIVRPEHSLFGYVFEPEEEQSK